jgi:CheY-like chemotaxis protein
MEVKVLIVEDKDFDKQILKDKFEKLGCSVAIVDNVEDALVALNNDTYHMITIDNSLIKSDIRSLTDDNEGQRLAYILQKSNWVTSTYAAFRTAVITNLADNAKLAVGAKKRDIEEYIEKGEIEAAFEPVPERHDDKGLLYTMVKEIQQTPKIEIDAALPDWYINNLQIDWRHYWPFPDIMGNILDKIQEPDALNLTQRKHIEFKILLQRLLPAEVDATLIRLKPVHVGFSATQVFEARYFKNTSAYPKVIIKVGSFYKIAREYSNYNRYVSNKIAQAATVISFARTQLFGGIIYRFVGVIDEFVPFGDRYNATALSEVSDLITIIQKLFDVTCNFWYSGEQKDTQVSLFQIYDEMLNLKKYQPFIGNVIKNLAQTTEFIRLLHNKIHFETLVGTPTFTNIAEALAKAPEFRRVVKLGISHGDMNENNIRVQAETRQPWLIDFQQTGEHHALRDFIQLETVIKLSLMPIGYLQNYYHLENHLLQDFEPFNANNLNRLRETYEAPNDAYQKAFEVILKIRSMAFEKVPSDSEECEDYFIGLMLYNYNAIRYIEERLDDDKHTLSQDEKQRLVLKQVAALLSASMIVDKLDIPD